MSLIGSFGLCKKSNYDILQTSVTTDDFNMAETAIETICNELEDSSPEMELASCSGEVFTALFYYLEINHGIDVRKQEDFDKLGEIWRNTTGDFDMIPFTEKEQTQLLSLSGTINFDKMKQFVDDFFQADFGEAGKIACDNLFENLKRLQPGYVLIWRLN